MSASTLLMELFEYKAWANKETFASLAALDPSKFKVEHRTAILLMNHAHTVDLIFVANLQQQRHQFEATGAAEPPLLEELLERVRKTDAWYVRYVQDLNAADLSTDIEFTFTDGSPGRMSREEMLAHVITRGGYHRGEVGRILSQLSLSRPRDIFTGFLHQSQPERRDRALTAAPVAER